MRILILAALTAVSQYGVAQTTVNADDNKALMTNRAFASAPFSATKYVSLVSGHPYYSELWMRGDITAMDSAVFKDLNLKMDLNDNVIIYRNDKNEEMVSSGPVRSVILHDPTSGKDVVFEQVSQVFYERLTNGPVNLYKRYFKRKLESKAYGSSVTEQNMVTEDQYYVKLTTGMVRINKPADLADVFPGKAKEIDEYVSKNKLKGKKGADYVAVVDYYNSLTK